MFRPGFRATGPAIRGRDERPVARTPLPMPTTGGKSLSVKPLQQSPREDALSPATRHQPVGCAISLGELG
jgi:hypothetical protein